MVPGHPPPPGPVLEVRNLVRRFGPVRAVNGLSFTVEPGEVVAFLGPNGAGKTTTLRMICGFLAPTAGSVRICGHDVAREPVAARRCLGYLPEGAPLYPDMTPRALLGFAATMRGLSWGERRRAVARAVARARLEEVLDRPVETLSKGYRRRVALAQAILHDPPVLLLDEPTDGLDPNQKEGVRRLIRELAGDRVVLLSTHILEEVDAVCSRVLVLARGRLLFDGTPDEFRARSRRHGGLRMVLRGVETTAALALLRSLGEVRQVLVEEECADPGPDGRGPRLGLVVLPRTGAELLVPVLRQVEQHGWVVETLGVVQGQLEEVFRRMTAGHPEGGA